VGSSSHDAASGKCSTSVIELYAAAQCGVGQAASSTAHSGHAGTGWFSAQSALPPHARNAHASSDVVWRQVLPIRELRVAACVRQAVPRHGTGRHARHLRLTRGASVHPKKVIAQRLILGRNSNGTAADSPGRGRIRAAIHNPATPHTPRAPNLITGFRPTHRAITARHPPQIDARGA